MLVDVCGCGTGQHWTSSAYGSSIIVGTGRTAAGTNFMARVETRAIAGSHCPLNVDISESNRLGFIRECYSRLENPGQARVECIVGTLAVHAQVQSATRQVRLNLSNHRRITSPVILIPRSLGGPATIYYQALRGPTPIPVSLTEFDGYGHILGVMRSSHVVECTPQLIHHIAAQERILAKIPAPGGATLTVTYQPYRILGTTGYGLKMTLKKQQESRTVGSGALRIAMPLEWDARRICSQPPYALVYGIAPRENEVLVRAGGVHHLQAVAVPVTVRPNSKLVYGFEHALPRALIVRSGAAIIEHNVEGVVAEIPCS